MTTIETKRLLLRPWRESDAQDLYELARDPDIAHNIGWAPHQSLKETQYFMSISYLNFDHTWAIELKETGKLIGAIDYSTQEISHVCEGEEEVEVSYWIGKPHWNKGYATEALRCLIDYCFNKNDILTVWAGFFEDNLASGRVMEKCGFIDTGMTFDYSFLYHGEGRPVVYMRLDKMIPMSSIQ